MSRTAFVWDGIEHWTGADLMDTIRLISSDDEAASFMEAYTAACDDEEHAVANLRYMLEIIAHDSDNDDSEQDAQELADLFMVDIPASNEVIYPRNWWSNSSCGIKVAA